MTNEQGWKETLEDLDLRRERSRAMGGPERLAKHRGKGKLDARARLEYLLDKGSFVSSAPSSAARSRPTGSSPAPGMIDGHRSWSAPRTSPRWQAASAPAATPSATGSPSWRCATGSRW